MQRISASAKRRRTRILHRTASVHNPIREESMRMKRSLLASLGKEYFDAVVDHDKIAAVVIRMRGGS